MKMKKVVSMYRPKPVYPLGESQNIFWVLVGLGSIFTILHYFHYSMLSIVTTGMATISILMLVCISLLNRILKKMSS